MSGVPPAASETMILTGLLGQLCALAGIGDSSSNPNSIAAVRDNADMVFSRMIVPVQRQRLRIGETLGIGNDTVTVFEGTPPCPAAR